MALKKILIVEDEPAIRMLLRDIFTHSRNNVVSCASVPEAQYALAQHVFDLVITDVRLHREDRGGLDLLDYIRAQFPGTGVIVMTGHGTEDMKEEALAKGAVCFYEKPFDIRHLMALVQSRFNISVRSLSN